MDPPEHADTDEKESVTSETNNVREENSVNDVVYVPPFGDNGFQGPLTEDGSNGLGVNSAGFTRKYNNNISWWRFLQFLLLFF